MFIPCNFIYAKNHTALKHQWHKERIKKIIIKYHERIRGREDGRAEKNIVIII